MRLVRINVVKPIETFYSSTVNSEEAPVQSSTYWLDAWAGPEPNTESEYENNAEFHFPVKLSSCREYLWLNYEGIFLFDATKLTSNAADLKTKALFHPGTKYVRCNFESGTFDGRHFKYTVLVLDTWTLVAPEDSKLANIHQSKFCSAIFLGDRLMELGTDNGCVVISIALRPQNAGGAEAPIWNFTVAWDDRGRV